MFVQVEAGAAARKVDSARMGMTPSAVSAPTVMDAAARNKGMKSSGACAAAFTSTDMDVVTVSAAPVETAKDKQRLMYGNMHSNLYMHSFRYCDNRGCRKKDWHCHTCFCYCF